MTNPYGITLDRAWTEWAAEYGVSPTVAAALFLISVHRPAHEVAAKLTACEFKQVIDIVRRWPNNFAIGTLAALETQKHAAQRELTTSTSTDGASGRPGAGIKASAEDTRRTHECKFESFRIHAPQTAPKLERASAAKPERALSTEKAGTHPGTLADILRRRMVVEDLRGLGLSIRGIAAATGIPRSSVHRAVRAMARVQAKQEADTIEIMKKLLGKRLSRQGEHSRG